MALLSAARELPSTELDQLDQALGRARGFAAHLPYDTDRARTLRFATEEFQHRFTSLT